MAEIVGTIASALALGGLFKLCIEAFDVVQTAKNQAVDLKKLTLKLSIERCRLWIWGQAMGLTQHLPPGSSKPLDDCPFHAVVEESLSSIVCLFNDSEALRSKYGCRNLQEGDEPLPLPGVSTPGPIERLSISFNNFKVRNVSKMKQAGFVQKGSWVIHDRKRFELLISEVKTLIDGLQDITKNVASLASQDRIIRSRITTIDDVETLDMVAEVCEKDHPRFSDAASTKAEAISLSTTFKHNILDWADTIEDSNSDTETIDAIESWTTTEMKHMLFSLLKNRRNRVAANEAAVQQDDTDEHLMTVAMVEKPAPQELKGEEALHYWGYLFETSKSGSDKLKRLLQGIAHYIAANFEPTDNPDLTPSQLAAFYRSVGENFDVLFIEHSSSAIAFIFRTLGCLFSLQPVPSAENFTEPSIPALRPRGFVTWQTIQLLMWPEQTVPVLQNALKQYDITDPVDGTLFPKVLPTEAFPDKPDQDMLDWYDKVSEHLKRNAERSSGDALMSDTLEAQPSGHYQRFGKDPLTY